jgi:hypothetical protein
MERLTSIRQENERYPTTIRQSDDTTWNYFYALIPENVRPLIEQQSVGETEEH